MKVAVGLSGGVDSSVAALLLREQGHEVVGITMKLWRPGRYKGGDNGSCFGPGEEENIARASATAARLGIPYRVYDVFEEYDRAVVGYFRDTYLSGRTPNPCVRCNELVKFGLLPRLARAAGLDFDAFATGHYARIGEKLKVKGERLKVKGEGVEVEGEKLKVKGERLKVKGEGVEEEGKRYFLRRAKDVAKDQSYFLYRLSQEQLAQTLFPLGEMDKAAVREIARRAGLDAANRPDSQDFYSGDQAELIGAPDREGNIVDVHGKVLGRHRGYWHYTIGKRKGLGIGGGTPYYVVDLNACRNEVIVGFREDAVRTELSVADMVWGALEPTDEPTPCRVKVRSAGEPKGPATLIGSRCVFPNGISGVAPGQSAVFYAADSDEILCGGIIQ